MENLVNFVFGSWAKRIHQGVIIGIVSVLRQNRINTTKVAEAVEIGKRCVSRCLEDQLTSVVVLGRESVSANYCQKHNTSYRIAAYATTCIAMLTPHSEIIKAPKRSSPVTAPSL